MVYIGREGRALECLDAFSKAQPYKSASMLVKVANKARR